MSTPKASTSFQCTKEQENFVRLCMLLIELCSDVLQDTLRQYIPENQLSKELKLKHNLVRLNSSQRKLVFPSPSNVYSGTYSEFDVSFLYTLLRNLCGAVLTHRRGWGNEPDLTDRCVAANVERLRLFRNEQFGHLSSTSVDEKTFNDTWTNVRQAVIELERNLLPQNKYIDNYGDAIDKLKVMKLDPKQEERYVTLLREQTHIAAEIESLKDSEQFEKHEKRIKAFEEKDKLHKDSLKRKVDSEQFEDHENRIKAFEEKDKLYKASATNTIQEHILANTRARIDSHSTNECYTATRMVDLVIGKLANDHVVILSGKAGAGKTTLALEVMRKLSGEKNTYDSQVPAILNDASNWENVVNCERNMVVFVDDPIGRTNFDEESCDKWERQFDNMFASAKHGKIYIIMGIRSHILRDSQDRLDRYGLFRSTNLVDLSIKDYELNENEKRDMINKYCEHYSRHTTEKENQKIVETDPYYGFPYTCYLFFSKCSRFELKVNFFKHPKPLYNEIESLRLGKSTQKQQQYCVLVYTLINNEIDKTNINFQQMHKVCQNIGITDLKQVDIEDAIDSLKDVYLSCTGCLEEVFTFIHETILETVFVSFGRVAPSMAIGTCGETALRELIRPCYRPCKVDEVVLKIYRSDYYILVDRLLATDPFTQSVERVTLIRLIDEICGDPELTKLHKTLSDGEFGEALCRITLHMSLHFKFFIACRFDIFNTVKRELDLNQNAEEVKSHLPRKVISHSLHQAAVHGHLATVKVFMEYDKTLAETKYFGKQMYISLIHVAAAINHVSLVEYLLSFRPDLRRTYDFLNIKTCIHDCIMNDCSDVLEYLFQTDPTLANLTDRRGGTLISYAAAMGKMNMVMFLYKHKADVRLYKKPGKTVLHYCIDNNWSDIIETMIRDDPTLVDIVDSNGTPLLDYADSIDRQSIVTLLYQYGANKEDIKQMNEIKLLVKSGNYNELELLIKSDQAIVNLTGLSKDPLICYAALLGNIHMAELIYRHNADLKGFDKHGCSALHYCIAQGWDDLVKVLIEKNSDLIVPTSKNQWLCVHIAAFFGRVSLVKTFEALGQSLLDLTSEQYDVLKTTLLGLRFGPCAKVNVANKIYTDVKKQNCIHLDTTFGNEKNYRDLLQYIFLKYPNSVNGLTKPLDSAGNTILHYLVLYDGRNLIDYVVGANRDVLFVRNSAINHKLSSVLDYAAYMGRYALAVKLWEAGVRPQFDDVSLIETAESNISRCGQVMPSAEMVMLVNPLNIRFGSNDEFIQIVSYLKKASSKE